MDFLKDCGAGDDDGGGDDCDVDVVWTLDFGFVEDSFVWKNYQTEKEYRKCSVTRDGLKKTKLILFEIEELKAKNCLLLHLGVRHALFFIRKEYLKKYHVL